MPVSINKDVGECKLCGLAVMPGQGRLSIDRVFDDETDEPIEHRILVHADLDFCKRLKKEHMERQERAMKRMLLRRRLVERVMQRGA